jgi:hypothetical protein
MDVTDLSGEQIRTGLRAWARGLYAAEAAVEVLVVHRYWLGRAGFRRAALWISDGFSVRGTKVAEFTDQQLCVAPPRPEALPVWP